MTPRTRFNSLFLCIMVVPVSLVSMPSGVAGAGGSYVYYEDSYATPDDSDSDSGDGWSWSYSCSADPGSGGPSASASASAWVYISSGGGSLYKSPGKSTGAYATWTEGYEWDPDPLDPYEVPPGGTVNWSGSGQGDAGAEGTGWESGTLYAFVGSGSASAASSGGGYASPGGSADGGASCSGAVGENGYPSIGYLYYPTGYLRAYNASTPGYFLVSVHWSASDSDSGVPVAEGTTSVAGSTSAGAGASADTTASWNGQQEGSAGGSGSASSSASGNITFSFSSP